MTTRACVLVIAVLALSCSRPHVNLGEACQINSDCADPLACVIGVCRRQCVDSRDCGAGLRCIVSSGSALGGGCQLPVEAMCTLTSECGRASLVCQNGTCTTPCRDDRDCSASAHCTTDSHGTVGCFDTSVQPCIYASDCPDPMICDRDQTCRFECVGDRDCSAPRLCVSHLCQLPDGGTTGDAGP